MVEWNKDGQGYFTFDEAVSHPVVDKMFNNLKLNTKVIDELKKDFYYVFNRHNNAWSRERMERDYGLKNLVKVTWNAKERCFHVHYKNGDWWRYTLSGDWY